MLIDVRIPSDLKPAGSQDSLVGSVNYGQISKAITKAVEGGGEYTCLEGILHAVQRELEVPCHPWVPSEFKITLPKGALMTEGVGISFDVQTESLDFLVQRLRVACIIGINDHERLARQDLAIDLRFRGINRFLQQNYQGLIAKIVEVRLRLFDWVFWRSDSTYDSLSQPPRIRR